MNNILELMGLTTNDFTWFESGDVTGFVERQIPQIVNELAVEGEPLSITVINENEVPDYQTMKIAFMFRGAFLPVYESGEFYVKADGSLATVKRNDGFALLGIRNES